MKREKIKKGDPLRIVGGGVVYAISNETAAGEVLVRSPSNLRQCVYLPVGEVLPWRHKPTPNTRGAWAWFTP